MSEELLKKLIDAGVIGIVVSIILAIAAWLSSVMKEWNARNRKARYLAIRVVPVLDQYIYDCAASVADDGTSFGQPDENGYLLPQEPLPTPPKYSNDIDWISIDYSLMYNLILLRHKAKKLMKP